MYCGEFERLILNTRERMWSEIRKHRVLLLLLAGYTYGHLLF